MDPLDEAVRGHARDIPQTTEEERRPLRVQHPLGPLLGSLPPDVLRNEVFARLDSRSRRYFVLAVCWPAMNDRARWKLYPQSYEWRQHVSIQVARAGDAELLRFAHEHGCPLDGETCEEAAERGHLDCLRYAHEHGCPWNAYTCVEAAKHGHLDCLLCARVDGCPCPENTEPCESDETTRAASGLDADDFRSLRAPTDATMYKMTTKTTTRFASGTPPPYCIYSTPRSHLPPSRPRRPTGSIPRPARRAIRATAYTTAPSAPRTRASATRRSSPPR